MLGSVIVFTMGEYYAFLNHRQQLHEEEFAGLPSIWRLCVRYILIFWLGVVDAMISTALLTLITQLLVGELRPDFLDRIARKDAHLIYKGRFSFPSGHTSSSFAWATFVSLYAFHLFFVSPRQPHEQLARGIVVEEQTPFFSSSLDSWILRLDSSPRCHHMLKYLFHELIYILKCAAFIVPLLLSLLVGISRINDHRHHVWDVVGGALFGICISTAVFFRIIFSYMSRSEYVTLVMNEVHTSSTRTCFQL